MTSSALASSVAGIWRPSALAVLGFYEKLKIGRLRNRVSADLGRIDRVSSCDVWLVMQNDVQQ